MAVWLVIHAYAVWVLVAWEQPLLSLLNRLSDYLFTVARLENHRAGVPDQSWESGR